MFEIAGVRSSLKTQLTLLVGSDYSTFLFVQYQEVENSMKSFY